MTSIENKEHRVSDAMSEKINAFNDTKNGANACAVTNEALLVAIAEASTAEKSVAAAKAVEAEARAVVAAAKAVAAVAVAPASAFITMNIVQCSQDSAVLNNDKELHIATAAMSSMTLDKSTKITANQPTIKNANGHIKTLPPNKTSTVATKAKSNTFSISEPMLYLNPITLDAQYFLNTIQANIATCTNLDPALVDALETVMLSISKILQQNNAVFVVETEQVKFVDPLELGNIKRAFECTKCNSYIGDTAEQAAAHLAKQHKSIKSKRSREKRSKNKEEAANMKSQKENINNESKTEDKNYKNEKEVRKLSATEIKTVKEKTKNQDEKNGKNNNNGNNEENPAAKTGKRQRKPEADKKEKQHLPKKARALINNNMQKFFVDHIQLAEALRHMSQYNHIEKDLMELLKIVFPRQSVKLYKFGSRISGIGTRDSDLDIYVDISNTFSNFENRATPKTISHICMVRDALSKNQGKWKNVVAITNARVPILKVLHFSTGIECDIGFSNSLGYCNTKLLQYLIDLQPVARCLCIFMKKWLDRSKLINFSSYAMALMVIYYLQVKKLLPSIKKLQMSLGSRANVGPWVINFAEISLKDLKIDEVNVNAGAVKILLKNFFNFYDSFAFDKYVVCPYLGNANIELNQIESIMPKNYHDSMQASGYNYRLEIVEKSIVVQDPIQLNHNVTKNISSNMLRNFKSYIADSKQLFAEIE